MRPVNQGNEIQLQPRIAEMLKSLADESGEHEESVVTRLILAERDRRTANGAAVERQCDCGSCATVSR